MDVKISREDMRDFSLLGLGVDDVRSLAVEFYKLCVLDELYVTVDELLAVLDLPLTRLHVGILTLATDKQRMNFRDFVLNIWTFLSANNDLLLHAAFDIYHSDKTEYLTLDGIKTLLQDINGGHFVLDSTTLNIIDRMETTITKKVARDEFVYTMRRYPRLVAPLYIIQV